MSKLRKRSSSNNSYHLATWERFNVPQLMVNSPKDDEINIFGPIVSEDTAEMWQWWFDTDYYTSEVDIQKFLAESTAQNIKMIVNSPGGDVWAGNAIRSFIQTEMGKGRTFETHVVGVAASAAAYIAVAAPKLVMADMAQMMIHRASVGYDLWGYGNEDDLQIAINDLESRKQSLREINKSQVKVFQDRMGKTREETQELLRKETWFNAESAVEAGLASEVQSSGITVAEFQPKSLPQGFSLTPHGGFAHERPAYSFAAAIGSSSNKKTNQEAHKPPVPEPPPPTQGVASMYEQDIRQALGIPVGTEVTIAHCYQYIASLKQENLDLKAEKEKVQKQASASKIKAYFDDLTARGAVTPVAAVSVQSQILLAPDPEAQFELIKPAFDSLPDGDNGGATARTSKGSGAVPDGADGLVKEDDETKKMAYAFKHRLNALVKAGEEIGSAQDKVVAELGEKYTEAYTYFDFDNDDSPLSPEEV